MPVTVTQVFDFLEQNGTGSFDRYEIASAAFGALRRSLRQIVVKLCESETQDGLDISGQLRSLLSEWLTVPVPFDKEMADSVRDLLGQKEAVQTRWGSDISALYVTAIQAINELQSSESPAREKIRTLIQELHSQSSSLKVFCHRQARTHFESIFTAGDSPISEDTFLHSVKDYRETDPFDTLVKFGPLRSRGWGSVPDAILTAPRFRSLVQIVWSGCSDEKDFGYDPAAPPEDSDPDNREKMVISASTARGPIKWNTRVIRSGEDPGSSLEYSLEADELLVFRAMNQTREKRSAVLVQIAGEVGILYPPHSQVLSFDTSAREGIDKRIPGHSLFEGMFIIIPHLGDVDLGGARAGQGRYSQIWKGRLEHEWKTDVNGLINRLRNAGLRLVHLQTAVQHWCRPASTVIHAPQILEHFGILMSVLGFDDEKADKAHQKALPFWHLAWNEVRQSRGQAIHEGFQEHEIIEEQLITILNSALPNIRENALANEVFIQEIPTSYGVKGYFIFYKILGIEEGFSVPGTELKSVLAMSVIDQWCE
jgi:hypothetical protein